MQDSSQGIAGHEGAGIVVSVGSGMEDRWSIGDRAGIKWIYSTCGSCHLCKNGGDDELHCPNKKHPGFNQPGTFQQYALSDGRYTTKIPDGVADEEVSSKPNCLFGKSNGHSSFLWLSNFQKFC